MRQILNKVSHSKDISKFHVSVMTCLLLCTAALSCRSWSLSHQLKSVTIVKRPFSSHAERFQDCSTVLLYIYRFLHTTLPLSEFQCRLIENLLDFYERFLYPFEVLSAISRTQNGSLVEEELVQVALSMVGNSSLEEIIQPLNAATSCAEACIVLILEFLQSSQDCVDRENSRFISSSLYLLLIMQSPGNVISEVIDEAENRQLLAMMRDPKITTAYYHIRSSYRCWTRGKDELPPNADIISLGPGYVIPTRLLFDIEQILHFGGISKEIVGYEMNHRISAKYEMVTIQQFASNSSHDDQNRTPDFTTLRLLGCLSERMTYSPAFDLERVRTGLALQKAACRCLELAKVPTRERELLRGLTDEEWDVEDERYAGELILHGTFQVSAEHGRPKSMIVYLFQRTLLIVRSNDSAAKLIYKIPLQSDIILTIFYSKEKLLRGTEGGGALMIYWFGQNEEEISGAKVFFHDMEMLQIWAGYLALHTGGAGSLTESTEKGTEESQKEYIQLCNILDGIFETSSNESDSDSES